MWLWQLIGILLTLLCLWQSVQALSSRIDTSHPLLRGLLAWYPVEPGANGRMWYDLVQDLHGTAGGGSPTWSTDPTGRFAGMLTFNGSNYMEVGNVAPLSFTLGQPFSVSFWYSKLNNDGSNVLAFEKKQAGANGYSIELYRGGTAQLIFFMQESTNNYVGNISVIPVNDGLIHHAVATYNGNKLSSGCLWYFDTIRLSQGTLQAGAPVGNVPAPGSLRFGNAGAGGSTGFIGRLSNIMFYNRVLTAEEVRVLYALQAPDYGGMLLSPTEYSALQIVTSFIPVRRKVNITGGN